MESHILDPRFFLQLAGCSHVKWLVFVHKAPRERPHVLAGGLFTLDEQKLWRAIYSSSDDSSINGDGWPGIGIGERHLDL